MQRAMKIAVVTLSLISFSVGSAEAGRCRRRNRCCWQPVATCCQPVPNVCHTFNRLSTSASDCQDAMGMKLGTGWYWQAYYYSTGKIVKNGPFATEALAQQNMKMTCPGTGCCPAKDPYYCAE